MAFFATIPTTNNVLIPFPARVFCHIITSLFIPVLIIIIIIIIIIIRCSRAYGFYRYPRGKSPSARLHIQSLHRVEFSILAQITLSDRQLHYGSSFITAIFISRFLSPSIKKALNLFCNNFISPVNPECMRSRLGVLPSVVLYSFCSTLLNVR